MSIERKNEGLQMGFLQFATCVSAMFVIYPNSLFLRKLVFRFARKYLHLKENTADRQKSYRIEN